MTRAHSCSPNALRVAWPPRTVRARSLFPNVAIPCHKRPSRGHLTAHGRLPRGDCLVHGADADNSVVLHAAEVRSGLVPRGNVVAKVSVSYLVRHEVIETNGHGPHTSGEDVLRVQTIPGTCADRCLPLRRATRSHVATARRIVGSFYHRSIAHSDTIQRRLVREVLERQPDEPGVKNLDDHVP
jgi:hypothetical protein